MSLRHTQTNIAPYCGFRFYMFIYRFFFERLFECLVVFLTFHQAGAENYRQYGPGPGSVSGSWAAYDMQRAQGQR